MTTKLMICASNQREITKLGLSDGRRVNFLKSMLEVVHGSLRYEFHLRNLGLSILLFAGVLAILALPASAKQMFARTFTVCAVDMNYTEMAAFVERIRVFHKKANRGMPSEHLRELLLLEDDFMKFELTTDFTLENLEQGPEIATKLWYRMSMGDARPISEIKVRFEDYRREVTISGTDRDSVNVFLLLVDEEIKKIGCSIGGF